MKSFNPLSPSLSSYILAVFIVIFLIVGLLPAQAIPFKVNAHHQAYNKRLEAQSGPPSIPSSSSNPPPIIETPINPETQETTEPATPVSNTPITKPNMRTGRIASWADVSQQKWKDVMP